MCVRVQNYRIGDRSAFKKINFESDAAINIIPILLAVIQVVPPLNLSRPLSRRFKSRNWLRIVKRIGFLVGRTSANFNSFAVCFLELDLKASQNS